MDRIEILETELYSYWRSTTSYRVRIALNLLHVPHKVTPVNLLTDDHLQASYSLVNASQSVPTLISATGHKITQSIAILEWLDENHPNRLLPMRNLDKRARIRDAAAIIATDIHPVNNLRVLKQLKDYGVEADQIRSWVQKWIQRGFLAYQDSIDESGRFSFGDEPTLADICLVPQMYSARRWDFDFHRFERLLQIEAACLDLEAFASAAPEAQADAVIPEELKAR